MKCHQCSQKATVQLAEIEASVPRALWLCAEHARQHALGAGAPHYDFLSEERACVNVDATQARIDAEGTVCVDLPDGQTHKLELRRDWHDGLRVVRRRPGEGQGPPYQFDLRVVG